MEFSSWSNETKNVIKSKDDYECVKWSMYVLAIISCDLWQPLGVKKIFNWSWINFICSDDHFQWADQITAGFWHVSYNNELKMKMDNKCNWMKN